MKLIHLSDLHLGKKLNEFSLLEDQKYILKQITALIKAEQPDGVIIAGDVYDKPIPPIEAIQLLDSFLTELSALSLSVFIISGNHDSAERLSFGASLFNKSNIYFSQLYDGSVQKITLTDQFGKVNFYLLPFVKPALVKHYYENEEINNFNDALRLAVQNIAPDTAERNVLIAHQFVTGASRCDSEEIFVGGLDNVDADLFAPFDYTALGHIHGPQNIGSPAVRYCGTPLKYSFSEWHQQKSVTVIELAEKGSLAVRTLPLTPLHDLVKLKGSYMELTDLKFYSELNRQDYFHITLTDEYDVVDALQKLRTVYPNLMQLEYANRRTQLDAEILADEAVEQKSELELFAEFYKLQNNMELSSQQEKIVQDLINSLKNN